MAKMNVIFNRPVKLGKVIYPKSKVAAEVEEKLLEGKFIDALIADGDIAIQAAPKAKEAPAKAAPKAKGEDK